MYEVIVDNVGTVYYGENGWRANTEYVRYVGKVNRGKGRVGEEVALLKDGVMVRGYCVSDEG